MAYAVDACDSVCMKLELLSQSLMKGGHIGQNFHLKSFESDHKKAVCSLEIIIPRQITQDGRKPTPSALKFCVETNKNTLRVEERLDALRPDTIFTDLGTVSTTNDIIQKVMDYVHTHIASRTQPDMIKVPAFDGLTPCKGA
jgi:hypothetical protein